MGKQHDDKLSSCLWGLIFGDFVDPYHFYSIYLEQKAPFGLCLQTEILHYVQLFGTFVTLSRVHVTCPQKYINAA